MTSIYWIFIILSSIVALDVVPTGRKMLVLVLTLITGILSQAGLILSISPTELLNQ